TPDYSSKTITGKTVITYKEINNRKALMQIDLQEPLLIDSIVVNDKIKSNFKHEENVWHVQVPKHTINSINRICIYYHGKPREAIRPPWDGGWIFKKDSLGRPWMSVACQGLGASVWYPCKDHQSDEPDRGASLTVIVPDSLIAVGNGRLKNKTSANGLSTYTWEVKNPINNYNIIPYIGKYVNWSDTLQGEKGTLDLNYWVLDYDLQKAQKQFTDAKRMLRAFEYWFGPYPFYEDGYKLVEAPHLGMEHQGAIAYGNGFQNGYKGTDLSGTGWGLKWDFIIVHESGHEWFANNITSNDLADMWIHESFTNYSETLFTEYYYGKEAGNEYNYGIRKKIENKNPVISKYGVNKESATTDKYYKGSNMIHLIRHSIDDDAKFRSILRGLNKTFYHQTVTTQQVETYISKQSKINFSKVFDQYLRNTQIPRLEYYYSPDKNYISFRWANCIKNFNLRLIMHAENVKLTIYPSEKWKTMKLTGIDPIFFDSDYLVKNYYITTEQVTSKN
ncbi:MAG: M1 family metallopeptidase, partial [Panacibacter sp.]